MNVMKKKGVLLSGDEAIVNGALESGVGYAASYPGTPASEIADGFAAIAKSAGVYFEYSVNEKVALEGAAGAAFSGIKSIVSFKHYGLNVAADSLLPLAYLGCPLVVIVADDPGCWSSVQAEQDTRWYSRMGHIPTLEPADSQEAKDMTKLAFRISAKYRLPIMVRMTTRVCYSNSLVSPGRVLKGKTKGKFTKREFKLGAGQTIKLHAELLKKLGRLSDEMENSRFNLIEHGAGRTGIVCSGVAYHYVKEALQELNVKLPVLKLGFSYPLPKAKIKKFAKSLSKIVVVEELEPVIENEIRAMTNLPVHGKDIFPEAGELTPEHLLAAIAQLLGKPVEPAGKNAAGRISRRTPFLCPGCPHRSTLYAAKTALGANKIMGGDIGCYMLGAYPPYKMFDFVVSMGASIGISHGIAKATGEKPVMFIGDSTFFHAGIPALINLVFNKADATVIVLDNRWTAMTGQQPNPGTGQTGIRDETKALQIGEIAKSCGCDSVKLSNAYNFNQLCADIKEAHSAKGVSVVVVKGECRLATVRRLTASGIAVQKFEIIKQKPELDSLAQFGCPAIKKDAGTWLIDSELCWGCSICMQLFPDCIKLKK